MIGDAIAATIGKIIDRAWPDPQQKAQAALALEELRQAGAFRELDAALKAIQTEASSNDPWTSRARPSFMYVFYGVLISLVVVAPAIGTVNPEAMKSFFQNVAAGFQAIPEALWWTFSAGYLGYTGARTYEKRTGVTK